MRGIMNIELVQQLKQQQILAPQMILSMDILLLTNQELEARIEKEFMENPALEILEKKVDAPSEDSKQAEDQKSADDGQQDIFEQLDNFQNLPRLDLFKPQRKTSSDFDKQEALQNIEGEPPGLRDYLLQQVHLMELPDHIIEISEFIINDIDDRGYLLHPEDSIRDSLGEEVNDEDFSTALSIVRSLDPAGVGAENLQECLALQLLRDCQSYPLEMEILQNHVEDLRQNKIPKIARDLGKTVDDIKYALEIISMLKPYPGREFSSKPKIYIRPDVIVQDNNGEFKITVQDQDLPPLRVSETCKQILSENRKNREVSSFLKKKIDSAHWLIQAVRQRHLTIQDIALCIVKFQSDFMKKGIENLKAMKMQTIADLVGVHISTISRAIKGKYIQTPFGMFEMKYFFTGGVERSDGELESRRNVYRQISELIDNEDKKHPLSDTAIARNLRTSGLDIARRTVTKYRDQEGIPPSRLRKEF